MTDRISFFLKVTKTEYINDLTKRGYLYLTLAEKFRNKELYGGSKVDSEEGSLPKYHKLLIDIGDNDFKNPKTIIDCSSAKPTGNECIYCLKSIYTKDVKDNKIIVKNSFFSELIEDDDWSKYSLLLISEIDKFLQYIENQVRKQEFSYRFQPVIYDDHCFHTEKSLFSPELSTELYFHKRKKFIEQSEYRILLSNTVHDDLRLKIGTSFFNSKNHVQIDDLTRIKNKHLMLTLK